ncbi:MAG: beta-N-acetylglucosaminidase domain-containing protein, partial [Bacteroidaceae bacterium]|nr:beta-N-acetylglucosaminidase domain-containing protein [Bacteroidaceae bacterium]
DAVNALAAKYETTGGSIELIIGERGDAAVAEFEMSIPSKAEGYYLQVTPERVVIAGNDERGTFYGVQSFLQVAAQPEVMSVTVADYPDVIERGVVEGFYGNNWSQTDRLRQFQFYGANKMNVYIYGPKDDPYHLARWREPYPTESANKMKELVAEAKRNKVKFVWAVHPGNDIQWNATDSANVVKKLKMMYDLGVRAFAVFFDDVWGGEGTRGIKQAQLLNYVTDNFVKKYDDVEPLILCPTQYNRGWAGGTYLSELRDNLYKEVKIMWTGHSVVDFINKGDTEWINAQIGRKAYIWLNYPVNDYCISRMLMGPTFGDDLNIAGDLSGYTSNPMEYAEASMLSLYSVADYTWNMADYDSNASWERAIKYLMPENAEAFKVFCENNVDLGVNTHGLRRTNESPRFAAASKNFDAQMAGGYNAEALAKVRAEFDLLVSSADQLLATSESPELMAEITPWVKVMRYVGQRGQLLCNLFDHLNAANPEAFVEDYLKILDLTEEQRSILSRDFPGS